MPMPCLMASVGLSIFAKYIPGKLFVILGKASYMNKKYGYSNLQLITQSTNDQLIALWTGLLIGCLSLFFVELNPVWLVLIGGGWLLITLTVFTTIFHKLAIKTIKLILNKEVQIPRLEFRSVIRLLPVHFIYWIILSAGFYFLGRSMLDLELPIHTGLIFPLATTLGLMAIIAPGGLGIRESIIGLFLSAQGITTTDVIALAALSRLWFLTGEFSIFFASLLITKLKGKTP